MSKGKRALEYLDSCTLTCKTIPGSFMIRHSCSIFDIPLESKFFPFDVDTALPAIELIHNLAGMKQHGIPACVTAMTIKMFPTRNVPLYLIID